MQLKHFVQKSLKMLQLIFFIEIDVFGNTVGPQAPGFQKHARLAILAF